MALPWLPTARRGGTWGTVDMTQRHQAAISTGTYEDLLRQQAAELTQLRLRRGNPSLRAIEARAGRLFGLEASLPISTQSAAFSGRYVSRDKLMWLVRTLMSWDEWGAECEPPGNRSHELDAWRTRWTAIAAAKPTRRRTPAAAAPAEAEPPAAVPLAPAPPAPAPPAPAPPAPAPPAAAPVEATPPQPPLKESAAGLPPRRSPDERPKPSGIASFLPASVVLTGHSSTIRSVAFSPDGALLATGGGDRTVRLWDPHTRAAVGEPLTGHTGAVYAVAFSPDGALLATGADDRTVRLWDRHTRTPIGDPLASHTSTVRSVAFSPDGSLLATASGDRTVRFWNPRTRAPVGEPLTGHTGAVHAMAFSPDGALLATGGGDQSVRLWDPRTRTPVGEPLTGHTGWVRSVAFSPDGTLLATASGDRTVRLWNPHARTSVGEPLTEHVSWLYAVAFSPDGALLATGGDDHMVRLWDPRTRTPVGDPLTGHADWVRSVAFSPDGTLLATASGDGTARLYEREALKDMTTRRLEFHHRVGAAMLNVYRGTTGGAGAPSEEPSAEVYRDVLEAAEATFARATETGDVEQMIAGWDEFTQIATHLGQSSALLGAVLLGSLVDHTGLSPQEVIGQAIAKAQAHPAGPWYIHRDLGPTAAAQTDLT
ncbi:WD40 repeat domain-containing protein [Streptomyces iranensis]|uniref:WD40 repeat domain-containing protein n=1 Tax=Streptomyces iranensis TaxID=576784 RepID=UPI0039B73204